MMVIKPHLALGLGLATLLKRQWRVVALSLGVVAISSAIASAILGFGIWAAFLDGASAAGGNMEEGHYPLFRMTSVYAAAFTAGASADLALAVHAAAAAVGVGSIVLAFSMGWPIARFLAVSLFASLSISPYNYDYDMPALAIALALLLPCIKQFALLHEHILLILSGWLCTGWGWAIYIWFQDGTEYEARKWLSLGGVGFCVMWLVVWRILLRAHAHETGRRWPVRPGGSILDHAWPRLRALRPRSGLPR
jgi:hypothetical protein